MNTFILFGRSGSGKGTQAELLIEKIKAAGNNVLYIQTGQRFREFLGRTDNYASRLTKQYLDDGELLPVFLPIRMWGEEMIEKFDGTQDLVLDGLARRMTEAPVLDSALKFYGITDDIHVIHINLSREVAIDRMLGRGREDDTKERVIERMDWYDRDVVPVLDYFKERKGYIFHDINGEQSIEDVHNDIMKAVDMA